LISFASFSSLYFFNILDHIKSSINPLYIEKMSNKKNNKKPVKYKKAPEAPKRFKSAYMFFSTAKHQEIREQYAKSIASEKVNDGIFDKNIKMRTHFFGFWFPIEQDCRDCQISIE